MSRARLVVSIGCPSGVGPEVAVVAASREPTRTLLVGDLGALRIAARIRGISPDRLVRVDDPREAFAAKSGRRLYVLQPTPALTAAERAFARPGRAAGAAQLAWIDAATDLVASGGADALVTGPVSKDAVAGSGVRGARSFRGHTEHLAKRLGASDVTMAFWTKRLTTSLVTTHVPLAAVSRRMTSRAVARAVYSTASFIERLGVLEAPLSLALAVAALNPHAGEGGLLGREERDVILPGIRAAKERLRRRGSTVVVSGPVPAETAFRHAASGRYDAVVAMYHDQATIPMKLLGFGEAVNVTLGLPIVRTSVDHGTAYDRAGTGTADARGMLAAMRLARRLVTADLIIGW